MIEPIIVHRVRMSSVFFIELLRVGPIWAVTECWPDGTGWKFFCSEEWPESVRQYKRAYNEAIKSDRVDKIDNDYWSIHHELIGHDELEKQYKEQYGEELYEDEEI